MNTTHKKLVGGLLIGLLLATVGAAFATGQTDDTTDDVTDGIHPQVLFEDRKEIIGLGPYASELTEEQQTQLDELMTTLKQQNATINEMRTAIQEKLDEFGVFDIQLDNKIAQTEQQLTILNRQKELRSEGYSWDEIQNIIEDEFGLENASGIGWDIIGGHGFGHGPHGDPRDFTADEGSID